MSAGHGELCFGAGPSGTTLHRALAHAPLKLLTPDNHGPAAWVFVATYGGGLVGGDSIALEVEVARGASGLLSTQASSKIYRARDGEGARQTIEARVAEDALLCVLPDLVAPFAGARYEQASTYALAPTASLVALEALSCGRSARGERWAFDRVASRTTIVRAGDVIARDALLLDASDQDLTRALGRFDALATLFAFGPKARRTREAMLSAAKAPLTHRGEVVVSASAIGEDGALLRVAGVNVEALQRFLRSTLASLRDELGDDPFARKW